MSAMFYRAVVQAVLLFEEETWVLNLEGVHVGSLRKMMGQKANRHREGTRRSEAAEKLLKEAGTQILGAYIDKWQATVAE